MNLRNFRFIKTISNQTLGKEFLVEIIFHLNTYFYFI